MRDLLHSVVSVESGFNPHAVSPKMAAGLMQLMPATAARFGVHDSFDPRENVHAGAKYLRLLLEKYKGNLTLALAAYNAGEAKRRSVWRRAAIPGNKNLRRNHQAAVRLRRISWRAAVRANRCAYQSNLPQIRFQLTAARVPCAPDDRPSRSRRQAVFRSAWTLLPLSELGETAFGSLTALQNAAALRC